MKKTTIAFYIFLVLSIAVNVFIIVEGGIGGEGSANQSFSITQIFIDFVKNINPNSPIVTDPETTHYVIRKLVGHFGLFGVSGILTTITYCLINEGLDKRKAEIIISSIFTGLLVAFISELMQLFAPGRVFAIADVGIDFSGYFLFGGITFLIFYLVHNKKEKDK